jgi:hypothetical protein
MPRNHERASGGNVRGLHKRAVVRTESFSRRVKEKSKQTSRCPNHDSTFAGICHNIQGYTCC